MPKPRNYKKACIYKIVSKNPEIPDCYVGSTTNLTQRKYKHKESIYKENQRDYLCYKSLFIRENGGWENFEVIVLEHCKDITNAEELRSREREWFDKLKPTLNTFRPSISIDELRKYKNEWRKKNYNPEKQSIQHKKYYQNNSEKEKQRSIKYYQENKEICLKKNKIKHKAWRENNQEIIECKCGSKIKKYKLSDHLKTKKHKKYIDSLE
jgi:group I intron endonuclease